jgi:hypothetical protein
MVPESLIAFDGRTSRVAQSWQKHTIFYSVRSERMLIEQL